MASSLVHLFTRLRSSARCMLGSGKGLAFCTIATHDFLPWALVLFQSLRRHHPDARLLLLYVTAAGEAPRLPVIEGVEVIGTGALLDGAREATLRRRYRIAEFCFALKPRLLGYALDRLGDRAVYLDSDIDVLRPLSAALRRLAFASAVLTPHLDQPIPDDGALPSDLTILRAGAFNLGFLAVREHPEARRLLAWWDQRVARWGYVAPESGYQGDQRWMDLAPALFRSLAILRDPGSNVGYWNLHSRDVRRARDRVVANGSPLAFFHFSGLDPERPSVLSRFQNRFWDDRPVSTELARGFAERLLAARPAAAALEWKETVTPPAPSARPATAAQGLLPEVAYRARLASSVPSGIFATGEEIELQVEVVNDSPVPWTVARQPDGSGGIALTWHVLRENLEVVSWDNRRFPLPHDLAPGESLLMTIGVGAPGATGRYVLELDLLHEDFTWFANHGSPTAHVRVLVGLPERAGESCGAP